MGSSLTPFDGLHAAKLTFWGFGGVIKDVVEVKTRALFCLTIY